MADGRVCVDTSVCECAIELMWRPGAVIIRCENFESTGTSSGSQALVHRQAPFKHMQGYMCDTVCLPIDIEIVAADTVRDSVK